MSQQIKVLINQLILTAKARDISQVKLAEMAGITAVGLSKAKHRGDIRASTLQRLASQLDLELALVPPRRPKQQTLAAIKSGSFFRTPHDADGKET